MHGSDVLIILPLLERSRPRLIQSIEWRKISDIETCAHTISISKINFICIVINFAKHFEWTVSSGLQLALALFRKAILP